MRLAGVTIIVLLLVVPLLAGFAWPAAGQTTPLGADMNNVFWLSAIATPAPPYILSGSYDPASGWTWKQKSIALYYDTSDLPSWVKHAKAYFVICYANLDRPAGANYLEVAVSAPKIPWPGVRIFASEFIFVAQPERCVSSLAPIDSSTIDDGVLYVEVRGPNPNAADAVGITITKLGIAPPEGASGADNGGQEQLNALTIFSNTFSAISAKYLPIMVLLGIILLLLLRR